MNIKHILAVPGLIGLCALSSCKKPPEPVEHGYSETSGDTFTVVEFSPWMSKADQKIAYESRDEGTYFAYTEGRSEGGFQQFRHVVKPLPAESKSQWGAYWGLSATEFYQVDLKLQREGFTRRNLQVFEDGSGAAFHQAVWLKKE